MVALHEKGLVEQVDCVRTPVDPLVPLEPFMDINPLSKIPTLEFENGQVLFDSHVICRWADREGQSGPILFPADLVAERDEALGTGLLDVAVPWLVESRLRPAEFRSNAVIASCQLKVNHGLNWLEENVNALSGRPFDIGHLSIGVALCYLDFRFAAEVWRQGRPRLSAWHEAFCRRPSVEKTQFRDDSKSAPSP